MKKDLNIYEEVLEIAKIAENIDFKIRSDIENDKDQIKKVINKPKKIRKVANEAYVKYMSEKQHQKNTER